MREIKGWERKKKFSHGEIEKKENKTNFFAWIVYSFCDAFFRKYNKSNDFEIDTLWNGRKEGEKVRKIRKKKGRTFLRKKCRL